LEAPYQSVLIRAMEETAFPEVKKGERTLMKIGDRFKDKTTGKIYIIKSEIDRDTLFLEGENGLGRKLIGKKSLKETCEKLEDIKT